MFYWVTSFPQLFEYTKFIQRYCGIFVFRTWKVKKTQIKSIKICFQQKILCVMQLTWIVVH